MTAKALRPFLVHAKNTPQSRRRSGTAAGSALMVKALIKRLEKEGKI